MPLLLKSVRKLSGDIAALYVIQGMNYLVPLLLIPFLARVLAAEGWGRVMFAYSFSSIMAVFIEYGFYISAQRDVARVAGDPIRLTEVYSTVLSSKIFLSIIVTLLFGGFGLLNRDLFGDLKVLFGALLLGNTIGFSMNWYFRGIGRIALSAGLEVIGKIIGAGLILLLIRSPGDGWKYFLFLGIGQTLILIISFMLVDRRIGFYPSLRKAIRGIKKAYPVFVLHVIGSVFAVGNAFLLGLFAPATVVGYFSSAEKVARSVSMLLDPLRHALFPRFIRAMEESVSKTRVRVFQVSAAKTVIGLGLSILLYLCSPYLVNILFGDGFTPAVSSLKILSVLPAVIAVSGSYGFLWILPRGREKVCVPIMILAMGITISLAFFYAPGYGSIGMSWAVAASETFVAVAFFMIFLTDKIGSVRA